MPCFCCNISKRPITEIAQQQLGQPINCFGAGCVMFDRSAGEGDIYLQNQHLTRHRSALGGTIAGEFLGGPSYRTQYPVGGEAAKLWESTEPAGSC